MDSTKSLVSVCIPTCNRPKLLREAIHSVLAQTYQNFEIVVCDDSKDEVTAELIEELAKSNLGQMRYYRNMPPLGQAANVNSLFEKARGERLVLLHDDDLLMSDALEILSCCWLRQPDLTAAFGKQYFMKMSGEIMLEESKNANEQFNRTDQNAGLISMPIVGAIKRMFPNDGYMVLAERARAVGYRPLKEVGEACDFDFALRLCASPAKIWFVPQHTCAYRISDDGISKTAITAPFGYKILKETVVAPEAAAALSNERRFFAQNAVSGYARMGNGLAALKILLSNDYPLRQRLKPRFMFHALLTLVAIIGGLRGMRLLAKAIDFSRRVI